MLVRHRTLVAFALVAAYAVAALPVCLVRPPELGGVDPGHAMHHPAPAPAPHAEAASDPHAHHGHHAHHAMAETPTPASVTPVARPCLCGCKGWMRAAPSAGVSFVSLPAQNEAPTVPLLFARLAEDATPRAPSAPLDPPEHVPIAA